MKTKNLLLSALFAAATTMGSFAQTVITATVGTEAVTFDPGLITVVTYDGIGAIAWEEKIDGSNPDDSQKATQIIDFNFNIPVAGVYQLDIEYINPYGSDSRQNNIWVNGNKLGAYAYDQTNSQITSTGINSSIGAFFFTKGMQKISTQANWGFLGYKAMSLTALSNKTLLTTAGIVLNQLPNKINPDGDYVVEVNSANVSTTGVGLHLVSTPGLNTPLMAMWQGADYSLQIVYKVTVPTSGVYSVSFDHINTTTSDDRATHVIVNNCVRQNIQSYVTGRAIYNTTADGILLDENLEAAEIAETPYIGVIGRSDAGNFDLVAGDNIVRLRAAWGYNWYGNLHVSTTTGTVSGCNMGSITTITGVKSLLKGKTSKYVLQVANNEAFNVSSIAYNWSVVGTAATILNTNAATTQITLSGVDLGTVELMASLKGDPSVKFSIIVSITGVGTGTEDEIASLVSVYPNPSTGVVNVATGGLKAVSTTVYDVVGNVVLNTAASSFTLSTAGVYIVEVKTTSGVARKRVIIE